MAVRGTARKKEHTPVMRQFLGAKKQHPDAIIFFRLGDFYEMFYDDAARAASILDICQFASVMVKLEDQMISNAAIPGSRSRTSFNVVIKTQEHNTTLDPISSILKPSHR